MLTVEKLIGDELFIQCPLVSSGDFVKFCKERDITVSEKDLELYERLGILHPVARIEFSKFQEKIEYIENGTQYRVLGSLKEGAVWSGATKETYGHFWWTKALAEEFYKEGLLWSPKDRPFIPWDNFYDKGIHGRKKIESYYLTFQIYPLYMIKEALSCNLSLAWWTIYDEKVVDKFVATTKNIANQTVDALKKRNNLSDEIACSCQIISNRYFPKTQTDKRTITISHPQYYYDWDWRTYYRNWNARVELSKMKISEAELENYQETMAFTARNCDPLEYWYDLVQFVSLEKKKRLKGKALLAQTFYAMEMMLRLFYKDLTGVDLSEEKGINYKWKERVYGEGVPDSNMFFLEYLTNEFHLNPRPKLILIVEGKSEYEQIPRLAKQIGYSFDSLGIRIELLEGIGNFISGKIERFIDHYHNLQTFVYLILDNENNARQFKNKLLKQKSRYHNANRYITRDEYVFIWNTCFEFDNFSDDEIAHALSSISNDHNFTEIEIAECRKEYGKQADTLSALFKNKTGLALDKPLLAERLVDNLTANLKSEYINGKPKRKLLAKIEEIIDLAIRNYQPCSYEVWKENQESGYLGKKIE